MQTKSGAKKKSRNKGTVNDPTKRLHSSLAEVASFIKSASIGPLQAYTIEFAYS